MVAVEMTVDEVDDFLRRQGSGTLSLADGAESYAVPESFGYDGEHLYFQLVQTDDSRKMQFIETTEVATLTAWHEEPPRSVVVHGAIEPVPETEEAAAANAIAENAMVPTLNVLPDCTLEELGMTYYRLIPAEQSGRKFGVPPEAE